MISDGDDDDDNDNGERNVLACMNCSFLELRNVIQQINFGGNSITPCTNKNTCKQQPSRENYRLPLELSCHVAMFLTVPTVIPGQVEALRASSMDQTHGLTGCLVDSEESWWLSGFGSMPGGRGEEYIEFRLCPKPLLRRLVAVHVRIPPLPLGPLSVREFRIDIANEELQWQQLPHIYEVDNRSGMQRLRLESAVDAYCIRLVCLSNQISVFFGNRESSQFHNMEQVGFYAVQFE